MKLYARHFAGRDKKELAGQHGSLTLVKAQSAEGNEKPGRAGAPGARKWYSE